MDLRQLRYFVAVAELEHFRQAAERLHIAQPILSRHIKSLEEELAAELFERLPRGVRLTDAGRALLDDARSILAGAEAAADRARRVARGESGVLRVTFTEAGSWQGIIPDTIRAFREAFPAVKLVLRALDTTMQQRGLQNGSIDVGFLYELGGAIPDLESRTVQEDVVMLVVPASHRFASESDVPMRDLADEPMIWNVRATNVRYNNVLMAACLNKGFSPRIVQEVNNSATVISLVAVGIGVAFVPGRMRSRLQEGVVLKPVADLVLPFRTDIAWLRDNTSPLLNRFVTLALSLSTVVTQ